MNLNIGQDTRAGKDQGRTKQTRTSRGAHGTHGRARAGTQVTRTSLTTIHPNPSGHKPARKPHGSHGRTSQPSTQTQIHKPTRTGKKTPRGGSRDTHGTQHTRDTRAHTGTRITQTNLTTIQTQRHTRTTTRENAAGSASAGPEPTAPRGRLRRGCPQRTRLCLHPLPPKSPSDLVFRSELC